VRALRVVFAAVALAACLALAGGIRAVISTNMMDVFHEAVKSGERKKYSPALARLEALILAQPVTVGIDESNIPRDAPELRDTLDKALAMWNEALPDSPFVPAEPGKKPQVLVKFVSRMSDLPSAQGDIQAQRDFYWGRNDYSYKISATIRVVYRTGRRSITQAEASGIIAHELGHLIGLDDVTEDDCLMGYFIPGKPKTRVEPEEVEAALTFRRMVKEKIDDYKRLVRD
jgi:hypothetical protein